MVLIAMPSYAILVQTIHSFMYSDWYFFTS